MRHFSHHIGDYAAATQHLSFVEDAAYHRMMRLYYQTEKPLLSDLKGLARLVGARTKEEKEAVATVVDEFFTLEADGWHQRRCDAEIERYREKSLKAVEAGRKGGRPRREAKPLVNNETGKADASKAETVSVSEKKPTTQPLTLNPQPITNDHDEAASSAAAREPPPVVDDTDPGPIPRFLVRPHNPDIDEAWRLWKPIAYELSIPDPDFLNPERRKLLAERLAECAQGDAGGDWRPLWRHALENLRAATWLRDDADPSKPKHWVNLANLLKPENFTGLMEGRYAERHDAKPADSLHGNIEALAEWGRTGSG